MINAKLSYSVAKQCYENRQSLKKRISLALKLCLVFPKLAGEIESFFSATPARQFIMNLPGFRTCIYKQQVHRCFYRGSKHTERINFLKEHFQLLERYYCEPRLKEFYTASAAPLTICHGIAQVSFSIQYQHHISREGLLSLLLKINGIGLCRISFWITELNGRHTLCIGALQGGKDVIDEIREFTKLFWGIRPQIMALIALRMFAKSLNIQQIFTFSKKHLYSKKIAEKNTIDTLWDTQGATAIPASPFIKLELITPRKKLTDVPTHKRSLYKKRYAFLDNLEPILNTYFGSLVTQQSPVLNHSNVLTEDTPTQTTSHNIITLTYPKHISILETIEP